MLQLNQLILILLLTVSLYAQKSGQTNRQIYIAKTYTEFGEPIGTVNLNFVETGRTYSIILSNGNKEFKEHLVFLFIEKPGKKNSADQYSKLIRTLEGKYFVAFNYTFESEGRYIVYFTDFAKNKIASVSMTVKSPAVKPPEKAAIGESRPNLRIIFCKKIIGEVPVNHVNSVSLKNDGGEVYIFIADDNSLNTNTISISSWKKKKNTDYEQFADSKKFEVTPAWKNTFFKYRFENPGEFKINIYDENEILLKTAYITVDN